MFSSALERNLSAQNRINWIVWASFAWSIALLTGVAFYLCQAAPVPAGAGAFPAQLLVGLAVAALAALIANWWVRRFFLSEERLLASAGGSVVPPVGGPAGFSEGDLVVLRAAQAWRVGNVVSWALNDATSVLGLVAAILTRRFDFFLPFLALALVAHVLTFPRQDVFRERVKRLAVSCLGGSQ